MNRVTSSPRNSYIQVHDSRAATNPNVSAPLLRRCYDACSTIFSCPNSSFLALYGIGFTLVGVGAWMTTRPDTQITSGGGAATIVVGLLIIGSGSCACAIVKATNEREQERTNLGR